MAYIQYVVQTIPEGCFKKLNTGQDVKKRMKC
jgi:hypothetical protein